MRGGLCDIGLPVETEGHFSRTNGWGGSLGDGVRVADGGGGGPHAGLVMVSVKFLPLHKRLSTR
jgi:hypothetical protein